LKSAPNLRPGWRAAAMDGEALDLLAALRLSWRGRGLVCRAIGSTAGHFLSGFTARQTGMYRITTMLDSDQIAGAAIRACCACRFLPQAAAVDGGRFGAGRARSKSIIPCLEPCALMLEFARKVARLEQNATPSIRGAQASDAAEGDFDAPNNPRRLRFNLEKQALARKPAMD
jgi:hypothetical protein